MLDQFLIVVVFAYIPIQYNKSNPLHFLYLDPLDGLSLPINRSHSCKHRSPKSTHRRNSCSSIAAVFGYEHGSLTQNIGDNKRFLSTDKEHEDNHFSSTNKEMLLSNNNICLFQGHSYRVTSPVENKPHTKGSNNYKKNDREQHSKYRTYQPSIAQHSWI